jgi:thymidylate kinase
MKIALTGTHGIGKTTLLNNLDFYYASNGYRFNILTEAARSVAATVHMRTLSDIRYWTRSERDYFQWLVLAELLSKEMHAGANFISDRCVIDWLAYNIYYDCSHTFIDAAKELYYKHTPTYDCIFYIPIPRQFENAQLQDGFRLQDRESLVEVDDIICHLTVEAHPYTRIVSLGKDRDSWVKEISKILDVEILDTGTGF